jgi:hypothetical protein
VISLNLDGKLLNGNSIPDLNDRKIHTAEVELDYINIENRKVSGKNMHCDDKYEF